MDKNLHLTNAILISRKWMEINKIEIALNRDYEWWTASKNETENACLINTNGDFDFVPVTKECEIVPTLAFDNYISSDYLVGDRFMLKGLQFLIITTRHAICLSSIGSTQFTDEDRIDELRSRETPVNSLFHADAYIILKEWYQTFMQNTEVPMDYKLPAVQDLYKIIINGNNKWFIVNKANEELPFCLKEFDKYEEAETYINKWFETHPIPDEDIKAYLCHKY